MKGKGSHCEQAKLWRFSVTEILRNRSHVVTGQRYYSKHLKYLKVGST